LFIIRNGFHYSANDKRMKPSSLLRSAALLALALLTFGSVQAANTLYIDNRAPLHEKPFTALPLGSVQANGWLLKQLELQRDGLTGHGEEAIPELDSSNGWLGGKGENWEKGPYYVKGLVPLAYTLGDANLKAKSTKWIEWALKSQHTDGFYGPTSNDDWWPRMVMNHVLRDYADATGDARVVPFLTRYYRHMLGALPGRPLRDWGKARAGDDMETAFWLYNRTGDAFLLDLADLLKKQAYDWVAIHHQNQFQWFGDDFHPKHNVNIPQAMKLPPVYWLRSGAKEDRESIYEGQRQLMRDHGTSFGINSGSEFLSGTSSGQGVEFCSIVEQMLSDETSLQILGDPALGDHLENLAFNALPAAWTKDIRGYQYYTLANEVIAKRSANGFLQDYDDALLPGPHSGCHCCCYNVHMGWPKFTQNSWAATADNGLAVLAYAPTTVSANAGQGAGSPVRIVEETGYPFEEQVRFTVKPETPTAFPLKFRIPAWCAKPVVKVNDKKQGGVKPGTFLTLARTWTSGDVVTVDLPMPLRAVKGVNNSLHITSGPLLFSLRIKEQWTIATREKSGFHEYEITPESPWNYALAIDPKNPVASLTLTRLPMTESPFQNPPVTITAKAQRLPDWGLAAYGRMALDPPYSPVQSAEPVQSITLAPFGALSLRVTDLPWIGAPAPTPKSFNAAFEDGSMAGWVTYGGGWMIRNGSLKPASNAGGGVWPGVKAVATGARFADFTYEADVVVGPKGNAGVIFRVNKAAMGADAYLGYYVGLSAEGSNVQLGLADGSHYKSLGSAPLSVEPGKPHHLKIVAHGAKISVFVDDQPDSNQPKLVVTDSTYTFGAIGVRQYQSAAATFDNLRVRTQ
jgi:hypothetical protein